MVSKKIKFFQVRIKNRPQKKIIKLIKQIKPVVKRYNVKLIINDNYKLAKKVDADGCHLGQSDGSFSLAKSEFKKKIIGSTCHNSKRLIKNAIKNNADYIAIGSFFKSKLKPKATKADIKK